MEDEGGIEEGGTVMLVGLLKNGSMLSASLMVGARLFRPSGLIICIREFAMQFKTVLLSVAMLVFLAGCAGEPKHPTWKNATGAEQHERLMWQAIKAKQWKEVQFRMAPMFVGVAADGKKYDRAGWMAFWKSAPLQDYSIGEVTVDPAGTDMVVSYVLVFNSKTAGDSRSSENSNGGDNNIGSSPPVRVVSVWQQVKSGWMMTATSLTPVRE